MKKKDHDGPRWYNDHYFCCSPNENENTAYPIADFPDKCCGKQGWNKENEVCCGTGNSAVKGPKADHECCDKDIVDKATEICCLKDNGKFEKKSKSDKIKRCGTSGTTCYNPEIEACCRGNKVRTWDDVNKEKGNDGKGNNSENTPSPSGDPKDPDRAGSPVPPPPPTPGNPPPPGSPSPAPAGTPGQAPAGSPPADSTSDDDGFEYDDCD